MASGERKTPLRPSIAASSSTACLQRFRPTPLTFEIARRAARVDGEAKRQGAVIPFQDLVIGVTALEFDYAVATHNVRHFQMIPNLTVKGL
jgi:predicted nucleic acid-binding protein